MYSRPENGGEGTVPWVIDSHSETWRRYIFFFSSFESFDLAFWSKADPLNCSLLNLKNEWPSFPWTCSKSSGIKICVFWSLYNIDYWCFFNKSLKSSTFCLDINLVLVILKPNFNHQWGKSDSYIHMSDSEVRNKKLGEVFNNNTLFFPRVNRPRKNEWFDYWNNWVTYSLSEML